MAINKVSKTGGFDSSKGVNAPKLGTELTAVTLTTDVSVIDVLFETVSATATVGLSRNLTPFLTSIGKFIIIITMYLGRVGPISLAIAFKSKKESTNIILNPTEEVSIG